MDGYGAAVILKAMEGLSARVTATAENIANANTPNYRPLRVSFEDALAQAARKDVAAVRAVKPKITQAPLSEGALRLDLELADETATAGRYSAMVELLNRQLELQGLATMGNN
ncbi:MAG TPA: flagellar basal body protein [Caulobacteraceae bacterium]|jgi:flagellar basal-body rod protein FlgB